MGDNAGHDGTEVSGESRATVEAEPSDPEENGTEDDVRNVVRSVRETCGLFVSGTLAEHDGESESSGTGGDVDGCATGEIETAELERPTVRIPGPVGDRVVDDGRPDEDEDDAG